MNIPVSAGDVLEILGTMFVKQANHAWWGVLTDTVRISPEVFRSSGCLDESQCCCLEWLKIKLNGSLYTGAFPFKKSALYCLSSCLWVEPREDGWGIHRYWKWKKCSSVEHCRRFGRGCSPPKMNLTFYAFASQRPYDVLSFNRQESTPLGCACSRYLPAPASHSLPEGRRPRRRMQARAFLAVVRHVLLLRSKQNSSLSPGHRIITEDSVCSPHLWKKKRDRAIWEVVSRERESHYNASSRCQHAVGTTRYWTGDNKSNDLVCFHLRRIWRISYILCQRSSNDKNFTFLLTSNF